MQLEALALQTYAGAWELVVVDNGSTDGTRGFLGTLADRYPRLTVVVADRGTGAAYARNRGVEASRGEYLLFVDDDDRVGTTWLESMARAADQWDAIAGNTVEFRREPDGTETVVSEPRTEIPTHAFAFLPSLRGGNSGMRTSLFVDLGGFNEDYSTSGEDVDLYWRAQLAGHAIGFVPGALLHVPVRPGLRATWKITYRDALVNPRLYRDFQSRGMPRISVAQAARVWAALFVYALRDLRRRETREAWCARLALRAGRLVGSARYRVLYL